MKVDFDYHELLTIFCSLHCLDTVYGENIARVDLIKKVDNLLDDMNNLPIDQLYPYLCSSLTDVD